MDDWRQFDETFRQAQQRQQERERAEQEKKANMDESKRKTIEFVSNIAQPAFGEIEKELHGRGMTCQTVPKGSSITIHVAKPGGLPTRTGAFEWTVTVEPTSTASGIQVKASGTDVPAHKVKIERPGGVLLSGDKVNKDDIARSFRADFCRACLT